MQLTPELLGIAVKRELSQIPAAVRNGSGVTTVRNVSFAASLHDWLTGAGRLPHQLVDGCPQGQSDPCNAVCSCQ